MRTNPIPTMTNKEMIERHMPNKYKDLVLANIEKNHLNSKASSLPFILIITFSWRDTPEKYHFWESVYRLAIKDKLRYIRKAKEYKEYVASHKGELCQS